MAHLLRESLNSILTPSFTKCGALAKISIIAYSVAAPRNCPENWFATLSSSSPLVLMVALMISNTMAEDTEFDSKLRDRIVLLDSRHSHKFLTIESVRSQLAAERDSTAELSFKAVKRAAHFWSEICLILFRFISISSPSFAAACLITSSMFVELGASAG